MECPECGSPTAVTNSRVGEKAGRSANALFPYATYRRRVCTLGSCNYRFTTFEIRQDDLKEFKHVKRLLDQLTAILSQLIPEE